MAMVAWSPSKKKALVGAIRTEAGVPISNEDYRMDLAMRLANLVERCEDPQAVVDLLAEELEAEGLWDNQVNLTPDNVGVLIHSNVPMWERLNDLKLTDRALGRERPKAMPEAEEALREDQEAPPDQRVGTWLTNLLR